MSRCRPRRLVLALLCALLVLPAGCGRRPAGGHPGLPALEDLNVLLILVDTLGAKHLGCHTQGLTCSPVIDRLAREGVQFRRALTPAPWTEPAIASAFTSLMPSDHGVLYMFDALDRERTTLAELLKARGFRTAGVVSHFVIGRKYGYGQGFQFYSEAPVGDYTAITSGRVTDVAIAQLQRLRDDRFFLFAHYFDPHFFYNHHPEFDRTSGYRGRLHTRLGRDKLREMRFDLDRRDLDYLVGLYREEIAYTDYQIGRLLAELRRLDLERDTLVILTADHGEAFMEHGWIGHTRNLYDELLNVPLVFRLPGVLEPAVVEEPVSLLDLVPTLLGLSRRAEESPGWQGISLLDRLTGTAAAAPPARDLVAEVSFVQPADWSYADPSEKSVFMTTLMSGGLKLIHDLETERWELYDLAADPAEERDLAAAHDALPELRAQLAAWEREHVGAWGHNREALENAEPEAIRRIRSLGYVD